MTFLNWLSDFRRDIQKHHRFWISYLALVLVVWFAFDSGRFVERRQFNEQDFIASDSIVLKDLLPLLEKNTTSAQYGRLFITSDKAYYRDDLGLTHLVPDFSQSINQDILTRIKALKVDIAGDVAIQITPNTLSEHKLTSSVVLDFILRVGIISLYALIGWFLFNQVKTGALGGLSQTRFKRIEKGNPSLVKISDVAGHEGAKREVTEIIDFLKYPERFTKTGAKSPRGILLYGPPGNGKTLLAKAIAGESNANFLEQEASSFVQLYVGAGAMAIRQLFQEARKHKPTVIFIDEIDAIGTHRTSGGSEERQQALNALLVEMDGFSGNDGVVVIAATNRLEELDEALLRPGRFDRKVRIGLPSLSDRLKILQVHAQHIPQLTADLHRWADQTRGFSGGELAGLVNEAAVESSRQNKTDVGDAEFILARDRILMGARDFGRVTSPRDRQFVAFHELGHAVLRLHTLGKVEKISILPRSQSLGVTITQQETEDQVLQTEEQIWNDLLVLMGGRAAEELFCGAITGGAADDMQRASRLAREAVQRYGFDQFGPYVPEHESLIKEVEIKASDWVKRAYSEAKIVLQQHEEGIKQAVEILLEHEEIEGSLVEKYIHITPKLLEKSGQLTLL